MGSPSADTKTDTNIDATVKVERKGMSLLQWVGVVGVGSALLVYVIPRMMKQDAANQAFIQTKMFDVLEKSAIAQSKAADSMDDLADAVKDMSHGQEEFLQTLRPLTMQLDRVADSMVEQQRRDDVTGSQ